MCCDALKIIRSRDDLTGKSEGISRAERGASIIGHIIRNKAKRFGLRSRQPPGSDPAGGISGGHGPPRADRDLIVLRRCVRTYRGKQISIRHGQGPIREALSKTCVPGSASTVMLMWMLSEKRLVKTSAAVIQAAFAAVASAPKFVSNLAVNVGVMIKRSPPKIQSLRDLAAAGTCWAGRGRATPVVKPCVCCTSDLAAAGTCWAGRGRATPVVKPCVCCTSDLAAAGTCWAGRGRATPVVKPCVCCTSDLAAPGTCWAGRGRATPVVKPCVCCTSDLAAPGTGWAGCG